MVGVNVTEAWTESVGAGSVEGGALNDTDLTEGLAGVSRLRLVKMGMR